MKKIFVLSITVSLFAALLISGFTFAKPAPKVDVCHLDKDTGVFYLINISQNAWPAHMKHGDGLPGEAVPGMPSYKFAADCTPILILDVTGHWHGRSGLVGNLVYTFYMDLVQTGSTVTGTIVYTNYQATRTVSGTLVGNVLTITTSDASYWATVSGETSGTHFYGTGKDKNNSNVALEAWKQ